MRELGVGGSAEVADPQRIDTIPRELPAPAPERRRVEPIK
jgi:hypothetical protein